MLFETRNFEEFLMDDNSFDAIICAACILRNQSNLIESFFRYDRRKFENHRLDAKVYTVSSPLIPE